MSNKLKNLFDALKGDVSQCCIIPYEKQDNSLYAVPNLYADISQNSNVLPGFRLRLDEVENILHISET